MRSGNIFFMLCKYHFYSELILQDVVSAITLNFLLLSNVFEVMWRSLLLLGIFYKWQHDNSGGGRCNFGEQSIDLHSSAKSDLPDEDVLYFCYRCKRK